MAMPVDDNGFRPKDYWESRLKANWGLHGVGYLGLGRYNHWVYRVKRSVFNRVVRSLRLPIGFRALDIGSGTGFFIERWIELEAGEIAGVDLTEVAVSRLRSRFPGRQFIQGDISEDGVLPTGAVDVVSAIDVLFHIVDDRRYAAALENIHNVLSPGGHFVFSELLPHETAAAAKHHVSRTLADVERMIGNSGFSIVRRVPMHILMNQPLDSGSELAMRTWDRFTDLAERYQWFGAIAGALLYPIDLALVRVMRESPSTEIVVCRRN